MLSERLKEIIQEPQRVQSLLIWGLIGSIISLAASWFIHLIIPALLASRSHRYKAFPWLYDRRGFFSFFHVWYKVASKSGDIFRDGYEKVRFFVLTNYTYMYMYIHVYCRIQLPDQWCRFARPLECRTLCRSLRLPGDLCSCSLRS